MDAKDAIRNVIEFSYMVTGSYIDDLADDQLLVRSVPDTNHIAWQLGHSITSSVEMLKALGQPAPDLPAGFAAAYTKETATSDDPAKFHTKAEYVRLLDAMKSASMAAVDATPAGKLDDPTPPPMNEYVPTVGALLTLLGTHLVMHAGQFVPIRRKLGKPPLF